MSRVQYTFSRRGAIGDVYHYGKKMYRSAFGRKFPFAYNDDGTKSLSNTSRRVVRKYVPNPYPKSKDGSERKVKEVSTNAISYYADDASILTDSRLINGIEEGTSLDKRIGRKVKNTSLSIRCELESPTDFSPSRIRLCVVYDKQANGAQPTLAELFQGQAGTICSSYYNINNRQRFVFLYDKVIDMNPTCDATTMLKTVNIPVKIKGYDTTYNNTGSAITDIATGSIHFFGVSDDPTAGADSTKILISYTYRLRYTDK